MKKNRFGRTGLEVTKLGMGGVQLAKISTDQAIRVVTTGLDLGITFLETARGYWDSEEKMGKAIKGRRDKVVLASKAGAKSAEEIQQCIEESLKAFDTDYIDLYQYHGCDTKEAYGHITKAGGVLEGMLKAKEQGKIRAIGFSSHQLDLALEIIDDDVFDSAQLPISFMNVENHEKKLFEKDMKTLEVDEKKIIDEMGKNKHLMEIAVRFYVLRCNQTLQRILEEKE